MNLVPRQKVDSAESNLLNAHRVRKEPKPILTLRQKVDYNNADSTQVKPSKCTQSPKRNGA